MNATRAKSAAVRSVADAIKKSEQIAQAIQNVDDGGRAAAQGDAISATVAHTSLMRNGLDAPLHREVDAVEIDGVIFTRKANQEKAREELEHSQRWERLMRLLDHLPEARELALETHNDLGFSMTREFDDVMRHAGWTIVANGHADLWRVVFIEWRAGDAYVIGDEIRFLLREPTGQVTPVRV